MVRKINPNDDSINKIPRITGPFSFKHDYTPSQQQAMNGHINELKDLLSGNTKDPQVQQKIEQLRHQIQFTDLPAVKLSNHSSPAITDAMQYIDHQSGYTSYLASQASESTAVTATSKKSKKSAWRTMAGNMPVKPIQKTTSTALAPTKPSSSDNPALAEVQNLTAALANPSLPSADRINAQQELFEILSSTGPGSQKYGQISGPITTQTAEQVGIPTTGHIPGGGPAAKNSAWATGTDGYIPTNDWFQGMGGFPNQPGHPNSTGLYMTDWTGKPDGSIKFQVPNSFAEGGGAVNPWIQQNLDPGFTIGSLGCSGKPVVNWQETGNMARDVAYNDGGFVIHAVQGGLFQGATYKGMTPSLSVPPNGTMTKTTLPDGTLKYTIDAAGRNYFVYGNASLNLTYDASSGKLNSSGPYTGSINMASLDKNDPNLGIDAKNLDTHANAVIVNAQGTLLPNNQYQFSYICQDLNNKATANQPLVLMKQHQVSDLPNQKSTGLSYITLTGQMDAYEGATFVFNVPSPSKSQDPLDPLPTLPNGKDALTQAQALALVNDPSNNGVMQALQSTSTLQSGPSLYNKGIYQQGQTLAYAQKVLEIAFPTGNIPQNYLDAMQKVYTTMKANIGTISTNVQIDTDYGTIVAKEDDYGDHSMYNDHIVQYGYPLYALTCMKNYANTYAPTDKFFTDPIPGMKFSAQQLGDQLASDMGQTGTDGESPLNRNLDVYNSHSWLSGTQPSGDGKNTESESEAVFGSMSVAGWLKTTQPGSTQAQVAQTRWAMEVQGLQTYFQIDANSVYNKVCPKFVTDKTTGNLPPVVSNLWDNRVTSDTWWGLNWDRQLACEFMPAGANTMDAFLNNSSPNYQKQVANCILKNWNNFDTDNNIQSVLIAAVAKVYPEQVSRLTQDVESRGKMDVGTNGFILTVTGTYAQNQQSPPGPTFDAATDTNQIYNKATDTPPGIDFRTTFQKNLQKPLFSINATIAQFNSEVNAYNGISDPAEKLSYWTNRLLPDYTTLSNKLNTFKTNDVMNLLKSNASIINDNLKLPAPLTDAQFSSMASYIVNTKEVGLDLHAISALPPEPQPFDPSVAVDKLWSYTQYGSQPVNIPQVYMQHAAGFQRQMATYTAEVTKYNNMNPQQQAAERPTLINMYNVTFQGYNNSSGYDLLYGDGPGIVSDEACRILGLPLPMTQDQATAIGKVMDSRYLGPAPVLPPPPGTGPTPAQSTAAIYGDKNMKPSFHDQFMNSKVFTDIKQYQADLTAYNKNPTQSGYNAVITEFNIAQGEINALPTTVLILLRTNSAEIQTLMGGKIDPSQFSDIASYIVGTQEKGNIPAIAPPNPPGPPPTQTIDQYKQALLAWLGTPGHDANQYLRTKYINQIFGMIDRRDGQQIKTVADMLNWLNNGSGKSLMAGLTSQQIYSDDPGLTQSTQQDLFQTLGLTAPVPTPPGPPPTDDVQWLFQHYPNTIKPLYDNDVVQMTRQIKVGSSGDISSLMAAHFNQYKAMLQGHPLPPGTTIDQLARELCSKEWTDAGGKTPPGPPLPPS